MVVLGMLPRGAREVRDAIHIARIAYAEII